MSLLSGERSLHLTQVGKETTHGTPVACTAILPGFSTGISELDRSPSKVNEDWGELAMNEPNRGYYGARLAKLPFRGDLTYEGFMYHARSGIEGGVSPTTISTGIYQYEYLADLTSDTLDSQTIKEGDNLTAYQLSYGLVESYRLSFNTLTAPGNAPWQIDVNYIGQDKVPASFDAGAVAPSYWETAMGHLTRCYLGPVATDWASLSEQVGLLAIDQTIPTGVTPRIYGAANDTFQFHGRQKVDPTGNWTFFATAATLSALFSPFQVNSGGPVMAELRARIQARGSNISGTNDVQTLTPSATTATGGTFTITFGSVTSAPIPFNATASQIQAALWAMSNIGANNVLVTGSLASAIVVTFTNNQGDSAQTLLTANATALTGPGSPYTITGVDTTPGSGYRKLMTIDTRIRMSAVPVAEDANGATVYRAAVEWVKDPTLGAIYRVRMQNGVATLS